MPKSYPNRSNNTFQDLVGKRFTKLSPISYANNKWFCSCDCGGSIVVCSGNLNNGHTKSCGCLRKEQKEATFAKKMAIGQIDINGKRTPTFYSWEAMILRCTNKNFKMYFRYGGRGIKVCDRWLVFENFINDMGKRPDGMSLDRIDNNGNYSPDNCRWASPSQQSRNTSNNVLLTHNGETMCVAAWAEKLGLKDSTLRMRLKKGIALERLLTN